MPFDYLDRYEPAVSATFAEKTAEAWRRELRDRARLLMHLGYDKPAVARRLRRGLSWEFEIGDGAEFGAEIGGGVDALVDEVFTRS